MTGRNDRAVAWLIGAGIAVLGFKAPAVLAVIVEPLKWIGAVSLIAAIVLCGGACVARLGGRR